MGSSVAYVVSLGVEQVAVPDLVGRSASEAETALTEPAWSVPRARPTTPACPPVTS